ncbi:hypothetical protein [Legionella sainthelensi]|uniref:hypothetical protein n=1 Tax=Legionella sainthelensi TaxID=28087 RepID=UPI000E206BEB|nr:hypothetical protein [Legionella sainthelensi]
MGLFNVVVFSEEDKIKIKIEQVTAVVQENSPAETVEASIKSFQPIDFKGRDDVHSAFITKIPVFLENELAITKLERITFKAIDGWGLAGETEKNFYRDAVIYELPSDPNELMNFVRVVNDFARYQCSSAALSHNRSIDTVINEEKMEGGIYRFFDVLCYIDPTAEVYFKQAHRFIFNILNLTDIPAAYQKSIACLKNIMEHSLNACSKKDRFDENTTLLNFMLSGHNPYDLLNPSVCKLAKKNLIADLYTTFTKANEKEELSHLFTAMNKQAIKALYRPCIDMQAPDGGQYRFTYTEWHFLRRAEFHMRLDGRMSIIGLPNNKGYQKFYAEGQRNHEIFEKEMRHLGKIIGLEFAEDCDFHNELIFTEQCTQELKAKGLHYNSLYIAKVFAKESLAKARNVFFQPKNDLPEEPWVLSPYKGCNLL